MQHHRSESAPTSSNADTDIKDKHLPPTEEPEVEAEDAEWSAKKDRPPRFSTLFGAPPPSPPRQFESYPEPNRKSGVFLPMPVFVLFAIILLFESTLLFAYTVIGLYNNLPSRLVSSSAVGCACENQPSINIAPNFVMPQAQQPFTETVTVVGGKGLPDSLPTSTSTISISSSTILSTSTTEPNVASSQAAAAVASDLLGILGVTTRSTSSSASSTALPGVATSTEILSEIPPPRSTVNSVTLVTVNAAGSTIPPRPTVTSTLVIDTAQAAAASSSAAAESSIQAAVSGISARLSAELTATFASSTTPSTLVTSTAPPATTAPAASTVSAASSSAISTSSEGSSRTCFGGAGATELDCIN